VVSISSGEIALAKRGYALSVRILSPDLQVDSSNYEIVIKIDMRNCKSSCG
jgi:hypothetical protein